MSYFRPLSIDGKNFTYHVKDLTIKPGCATGWEVRIDSLKAIHYQTAEVHDDLMLLAASEMSDVGIRHEATTLAAQLIIFSFITSIVVWYDLLFQINIVSKQCKGKQKMLSQLLT